MCKNAYVVNSADLILLTSPILLVLLKCLKKVHMVNFLLTLLTLLTLLILLTLMTLPIFIDFLYLYENKPVLMPSSNIINSTTLRCFLKIVGKIR